MIMARPQHLTIPLGKAFRIQVIAASRPRAGFPRSRKISFRGEWSHCCSYRNWLPPLKDDGPPKGVSYLLEFDGLLPSRYRACLEAVMDSIRNGLGMRKTENRRGSGQPETSHSNAVFTQIHNTL